MLTLRSQDCLMTVDRLLFDHKDDICESRRIYHGSHVRDQTGNCLVVDLVLLKSTNVENADIVEPLTTIETTKNEELLCSDNTCCVTLTSCWCLLKFQRVRPVHGLGI